MTVIRKATPEELARLEQTTEVVIQIGRMLIGEIQASEESLSLMIELGHVLRDAVKSVRAVNSGKE